MIISLRGTNGSGKSTVVKRLLDRYKTTPVNLDNPPPLKGTVKPLGYRVEIPKLNQDLYVVGPYTTACGGCDSIQPYASIWPIVEQFHQLGGHVLFEGLLISASYGSIGVASEPYGDQMVFAFLDTPMEECIKRVLTRRATKGNTKEFNPKNLVNKYHASISAMGRIATKHGRRVVSIDHKNATKDIINLYRNG